MAEGNLTESAAVLAEGRRLAEAESLSQQLVSTGTISFNDVIGHKDPCLRNWLI